MGISVMKVVWWCRARLSLVFYVVMFYGYDVDVDVDGVYWLWV